MLITENCIIDNMPYDVYHSDPTPDLDGFAQSASLSSSMAAELLEKPENEALLSSIRLCAASHAKKKTKATDFGNIAHDYILKGGSSGVFEVVPYDSFRTNDAKAMRDDVERRGLIALSMNDADKYKTSLDKMLASLRTFFDQPGDYQGLFQSGKAERAVFVKDGDIWLRSLMDWTDDKYPDVIFDFKTTGLSFSGWEREQWTTSRMIQSLHYKRVMEVLTGRPHKFVYVVQQTMEPFNVMIVEIDKEYDEILGERYAIAREKFTRCIRTGEWPGITPVVHHSTMPTYIMQKWEAEIAAHKFAEQMRLAKAAEEPQSNYMAG